MGAQIVITQQRLKQQLVYDKDTGVFTWRINKCRVSVGDVAGRISKGYVRIKLDQRDYAAHRLAWLYVHGAWPTAQIDHRDLNRSNNRISNLREATNKQNHENVGLSNRNLSGHLGVWWDAERGKWRALITHHQKTKNIGRFDSKEKAIAARAEAVRTMFTHAEGCSA